MTPSVRTLKGSKTKGFRGAPLLCPRGSNARGFSNVYSFYPTTRKQIKLLLAEIEKLAPKHLNGKISSVYSLDGEAELLFKVKGNKHPIRITDNVAIGIIYQTLKDFISKRPENDSELLDSASVDLSGTTSLAQIKQVYLFNHYLSWFLNDLVPDKTIEASKKGQQVSYDKRFLVSRMIYATDLVKNHKYYDNQDFLKNNLKSYKDIEISTLNNFY